MYLKNMKVIAFINIYFRLFCTRIINNSEKKNPYKIAKEKSLVVPMKKDETPDLKI